MQPHIIKRGIPNITLLIVVYFTLMIVLLSCHSEKSVELEISPMELELSNIEEISYLQLTATAEWSVAVAADWCSVTPQSGRGSGTLTLIAQPNMGDKERVATLKVSSGGISREVKVVQPASTLLVEPDELNFTKEGGVLSIEIEANCEWEVLDPKDGWITFDPKKGEGSATLSITLEENSGSSRNGHITIRYGVRNKTISIKQQRATGSELYQPQLKTPSAGESGISRLPAFRWSSARKKGLVEEEVFYRLEIGEESGVWSEQIELTDTLLYWVDNLKADQLYYWQVTATDPFDQSTTTSTVGSFRTGERSSYRDGEYQIYQQLFSLPPH